MLLKNVDPLTQPSLNQGSYSDVNQSVEKT